MQDPIVETKTCRHCSVSFDITQGDMDFYKKISPKFDCSPGQGGDGEAEGVYIAEIPTPTLCPDCRQRRRLSFRNERKLYRRICDATKQPIISIYSPDKPYKVYDQKIRRSDARDPMDYGRDFDFSKTFTEQFGELMRDVPRVSLYGHSSNENCEYTNFFVSSKSCFACYGGAYNEDLLYATLSVELKDSCDTLSCIRGQHFYESVSCSDSYKLFRCLDIKDSNNCWYSQHCRGCSFCFGCIGLINKKYHIFNKSYSPESYHQKVLELLQKSYREADFITEKMQLLHKVYGENKVLDNSIDVEGNYIFNSKNVVNGYDVYDSEDGAYLTQVLGLYTSYDVYGCGYGERLYEMVGSSLNLSHIMAGIAIRDGCDAIFYSQDMSGCSHCFGCIGLRNKSYCIFNKQYTKEEYNTLVPKIIEHMKKTGEWGEFFHPSLSPFGYNETVAQEYYRFQKIANNTLIPVLPQVEKGQISRINYTDFGYHWSDYKAPVPQSDKVIDGKDLPDVGCADLEKQDSTYLKSILGYAIRGVVTGKLFRFQVAEIQFYKKHNIPLPRKHPDQRHLERLAWRE